ncbi:MAG TPA: hypothetical protein VHU23_00270 [Rhizomicrobium sp.]|nr:hypothetical protein [Rhizomicrobium sp.]
MSSVLEYLFESENADRLTRFFRARGSRARIIAPGWVRARIAAVDAQAAPELRASWTEDIESSAPTTEGNWNYIVVADDADRERAMIAKLAERGETKIHGLFRDVLPAILCGESNVSSGRQLPDLKRYAVLCLPRSGSRYLASVLDRHGLGAPKEHLREPLAKAITDGKLGFRNAVKGLERFGQRNGIFGTKLISSFLIKASHGDLSRLEGNIGWMAQRGYQFFYLDRPLNDAVISSYIASRLQKWHFFEQMDNATKDFLDKLEFDGDSALNEYIRFRAQKATFAYLGRRFSMPSFPYATLQDSIGSVVDAICNRLEVDQGSLIAGSASVPVSTRAESPTYGNFATALETMLQHNRNDIDSRTVKQLRTLVGIGRADAERMAAELNTG